MTVGLGADFRIAHCAPISLGPTRYSPSLLLPSAVFLHRHHRPAAQREKSLHPPHTRLRTRLSQWPAQRVNFERASGELPGGSLKKARRKYYTDPFTQPRGGHAVK